MYGNSAASVRGIVCMSRQTDTAAQEKDWAEWAELTSLMMAMESTHQCSLSLRITSSSSGYRSFVDVDATMTMLIGPALPLRLSLLSHYPHPQHHSICGLLRAMLLRLEKRVNEEVYRQRELPL